MQRDLSESMKQKIRAEYEAVGGSPDKPLKSNYFLNIIILVAVLALLTSLLGNWVCVMVCTCHWGTLTSVSFLIFVFLIQNRSFPSNSWELVNFVLVITDLFWCLKCLKFARFIKYAQNAVWTKELCMVSAALFFKWLNIEAELCLHLGPRCFGNWKTCDYKILFEETWWSGENLFRPRMTRSRMQLVDPHLDV